MWNKKVESGSGRSIWSATVYTKVFKSSNAISHGNVATFTASHRGRHWSCALRSSSQQRYYTIARTSSPSKSYTQSDTRVCCVPGALVLLLIFLFGRLSPTKPSGKSRALCRLCDKQLLWTTTNECSRNNVGLVCVTLSVAS